MVIPEYKVSATDNDPATALMAIKCGINSFPVILCTCVRPLGKNVPIRNPSIAVKKIPREHTTTVGIPIYKA